MNVSLFDNRRVRQGLTILMLFGALTCIFPPAHPAFEWWADNAVYVAVGYLLAGLFFLIINNQRLMFVCLGCSAAICFFKNELGEGTPGIRHTSPPFYLPDSAPLKKPDPNSFFLKPDTSDEPFKAH